MITFTKLRKTGALRKRAFFVVFSILPLLAIQGCKKDDITPPMDMSNNPKVQALSKSMRELWEDHMQWTYATVDAFFHNPDEINANMTRLLKNQRDIGDEIAIYYGQNAGDSLAHLLIDHIDDAVPVLTAAKNNDQTALNDALSAWYKNARDIADFLASANPNWKQDEMRDMMKTHIDQTTAYAVLLLQNDYDNAIQTYQQALAHMLMMSDDLTLGIAKQFPNKF